MNIKILLLTVAVSVSALGASAQQTDSVAMVKRQQEIQKNERQVKAIQKDIDRKDKKIKRAQKKQEKQERRMKRAERKADRQQRKRERDMKKLEKQQEKLQQMRNEVPAPPPTENP